MLNLLYSNDIDIRIFFHARFVSLTFLNDIFIIFNNTNQIICLRKQTERSDTTCCSCNIGGVRVIDKTSTGIKNLSIIK